MKILIIDDSALCKNMFSAALNDIDADIEVDGVLCEPQSIEAFKRSRPNMVFLDITTSRERAYEIIESIRDLDTEVPIIVLSSSESSDWQYTLKALNLGANDFIAKPSGCDYSDISFIKGRLKIIVFQLNNERLERYATDAEEHRSAFQENIGSGKNDSDCVDVIVIAASTGGNQAIATVFSGFTDKIQKVPILVVQHMPPLFTLLFAKSLDACQYVKVSEGIAGTAVLPGNAYIAPGGQHMVVRAGSDSKKIIELSDSPPENCVKPSADVLFRSVAEVYKGMNVLAVVMTGMGGDGAKGVEMLKKECNCYCITQSEETCIVYGMPHAVVKDNLSDEVVHLEDMSRRIEYIVSRKI